MSTDRESRQLVVFTLGSEHYALPIEHVQEIIRYCQPRAVSTRAPWVRGVISLRGRIIAIHDLASRLGVDARPGDRAKIVIVEAAGETAGVIVDDVEEVLTVEGAQVEVAPGADSTLIDAIAKLDERLLVLLNPTTVLTTDAELAAA